MKAGASVAAGLCLAACAGLPPMRAWLEADMARHMLLQFSALLLAGVNAHGATGLLFALLTLALWMVPRALDLALQSPAMALAKYASLLLTGAALRLSWRPAGAILQLFFLGNWAWMSATVGLLYQQTPSRLCNAYLMDGQRVAGEGLVLLALVVPVACLVAAMGSGWNCPGLGQSKRESGRLC